MSTKVSKHAGNIWEISLKKDGFSDAAIHMAS